MTNIREINDPLVGGLAVDGVNSAELEAQHSEDARSPHLRLTDVAAAEDRHQQRRPLRLGFLTFLSHANRSPRETLHEGLELFAGAEALGYDQGLVRVRHFQPFLSGPLSFLAAASQRTERLRLGTAVVPFHAEDPIRLAEELQNLDVISDGRLEIGVAATRPEPGVTTPWAERYRSKEAEWERFDEFLALIDGTPLTAAADTELPGVPAGTPITTTPAAPGLRQRIWYGPGTLGSVEHTVERGLKLQVSSLNTENTGQRFEPQQYEQIVRYREGIAARHPSFAPEVNASRNIFPLTGGPDDDKLRDLGAFFSDRLFPDGVHRTQNNFAARYSHPAVGSVDQIVEFLRSDVALQAADNLIVLVPSDFSVDENLRLLRVIAEEVAPALREQQPVAAVAR